MPGSSPPRSTRNSVYGPIFSFATTLRRSRLIDPFLQGQRLFSTCFRDRMHRSSGTRKRRDARHACDECGFTDQIAVGPGTRAEGRVDDEITATAADEIDDVRTLTILGDLADLFHIDPGRP